MVSSSVHRDPPDMQHQRGVGENPQAPPPISPPASASTRPGSVSERARLTKLPQPETALKCPRCESRNTKFCYYNNYNLSQPRHFCKTCRRFWTRGGALRNVPVGGGCRRNKKSERSTRSKSPVTGSSNSGISSTSCTTASTDIICQLPPAQFPFLPPLHDINDYGTGAIGFSFDGAPSPMAAAGGGFHFLSGLEPPAEMYQFQSEGFSQIEGVKFEEDGPNLPKNYLGVPGIDQFWSSGSAWSDLDGFTSSSVSHLL